MDLQTSCSSSSPDFLDLIVMEPLDLESDRAVRAKFLTDCQSPKDFRYVSAYLWYVY